MLPYYNKTYSKYKNIPQVIDGIRFDSKKESRVYTQLKLLRLDGAVKSFSCQPRYILQDKFEKNNKKYPVITYVGDFLVELKSGKFEVWDAKPWDSRKQKFLSTPEFKMKQKLFEHKYPDLQIVLV